MFKSVNEMVGDIVKVTPSSKMVGDMAIFMVKNDLTPENIVEKGQNLAFPDSAISYFQGMMGQPVGGFPEDLQNVVLKDTLPIDCRPGELLPPADFGDIKKLLEEKHGIKATMQDVISYALYPKVFEEYLAFRKTYGDLSRMNSPVFFDGICEGEVCEVEVDEGQVFIVKLVSIGKVDKDGYRKIDFEVNGNRREITLLDKSYNKGEVTSATIMADPDSSNEIGASIPGTVTKILVKSGEEVKKGHSLLVIEAMKMETQVVAPMDGKIIGIMVKEEQQVKNGELLVRIE
jgi:pyruvate carboxylase